MTENWRLGGAWHAEAMVIGVLGGEGERRSVIDDSYLIFIYSSTKGRMKPVVMAPKNLGV